MNTLPAANRADRGDSADSAALQPLLRQGWRALQRVWDGLSIYLPVILMGLLALLTYWLVRNTPIFITPPSAPPPAQEPDYTMQRFAVRHFDAGGQLRGEVLGDEARHFPVTDTLEVSAMRMRLYDAQGRVTRASAVRGITNADASEVQLIGTARIDRDATAAGPAVQFRGEFLQVSGRGERLRSNKPVEVTRGRDRFSADAMDYERATGVLELRGQVRVTLAPRP